MALGNWQSERKGKERTSLGYSLCPDRGERPRTPPWLQLGKKSCLAAGWQCAQTASIIRERARTGLERFLAACIQSWTVAAFPPLDFPPSLLLLTLPPCCTKGRDFGAAVYLAPFFWQPAKQPTGVSSVPRKTRFAGCSMHFSAHSAFIRNCVL